jgi:hypothetical protein
VKDHEGRGLGLDALFCVFVCLICCAWFYFQFFIPESLNIQYFYALSLFGCLIVTLKYCASSAKIQRADIYSMAVLLGLFIFSRGILWKYVDIWIDEYIQYIASFETKRSLIQLAFKDQQPPLDYIFSALSARVLPPSILGLKLGSLLWSFFFSLSLYFYSIKFSVEKVSAIAISCTALLIGPIMTNSFQARPLMLALTSCLFSLNFFFDYLRARKLRELLLFCCASFIFTLSTGLQPFVMIFILGLYGFLITLREKTNIKNLVFTFVALGVLSLPTLYYLFLGTHATNQFAAIDFLHLIAFLKGKYLVDLIRFLPEFFLITSTVAGASYLLRCRFYNHKYTLSLIYLFSIPLIYCSFISYSFQYRYALCFFVPFLMAVVESLGEIRPKKRQALVSFGLLFVLIVSFGFKGKTSTFPTHSHPGWRQVWQKLKESSTELDKILILNLRSPGEWRGSELVGKRIFQQKVKGSILSSSRYALKARGGEHIFLDKKADYSSLVGHSFFIIVNKSRSRLDSAGSLFQNRVLLETQGLVLYRLRKPEGESSAAFLNRELSLILAEYKDSLEVASLYETIIILRAKFISKDSAIELLSRYRSLARNAKEHFVTSDGTILNQRKIMNKNILLIEEFIKELP